MTTLQVLLGVLLLVGSLSSSGAQSPFCTPSSGSGGSGPALPDLPDVFETRIEITHIKPTPMSEDVRQQFDYNRRLASYFIQSHNVEMRLYFDYDVDQIHMVNLDPTMNVEGTLPDWITGGPIAMPCQSFPLSSTPLYNYYFGAVRENATHFKPKTVYDVLRFRNGDFSWAYEGTETVRGIPCDAWSSCQYQPETQSNYTVKFYFTRANYSMPHWSTDSRFSKVPVRAVYNGVRVENGVSIPYNQIYDYYDFRANRADQRGFFTPESVVCMNRKTTKNLPVNIGKRFRTSEETIMGNTVEYLKDFIYDEDLQLVRYEFRSGRKEEGTFWTTDPLTIINDYNVGVTFAYNHILRNCSIVGISNRTIDEDANFTSTLEQEHSYYVRMRSAESVLFLDRDYVYTGERYSSEDLPVKTYLSNTTNDFKTYTVVDYQFSTGVAVGVDNEIEDSVPVSYSYTVVGQNSIQANFYNFKTSFVSPHEFDTSMCFLKEDHMDIRITFPYSKYQLTAADLKEESWLEAYSYKMLVTNGKESLTRFGRPKISVSDNGNLYIRFQVVPPPPPISLFTQIPGKWLVGPSLQFFYELGSLEKCAAVCVERENCLSFDYNPDSTSCHIYDRHASTGTLTSSSWYHHYSRNTLKAFESKPTYKVYEQLLKEYQDGNIFMEVLFPTVQNPNNRVKLPASNVEILRAQTGLPGTGVFSLNKYDGKFGNKKFRSSDNLRPYEMLSVDECAKACMEEPTFECNSFDYCWNTDQCRLSPKIASDNPADYVDDYCSVFTQNQLFHYRRFPGRYSVNKKDINYKNVESPGDCATKCDKADKIHCRSFNYCEKEKACYISENHLVDTTDTQVADLLCTHYSRDFLSDFEFTASANMPLEAEIIYTGNSLDECSMLCVSADGFKCTSMDYCAKTKTCMLNSDKKIPKNETSGDVQRDQCNNYIRKYFYTTSSNLNEKKTSDNSSGVLLGLSLSFTILAIAGGAVGGHFYIKKRLAK